MDYAGVFDVDNVEDANWEGERERADRKRGDSAYMLRFGCLFLLWRRYLGLTQREAAEKAHIRQHHWCMVERGSQNLQVSTLEKMIAALELSLEEFLAGPPCFITASAGFDSWGSGGLPAMAAFSPVPYC